MGRWEEGRWVMGRDRIWTPTLHYDDDYDMTTWQDSREKRRDERRGEDTWYYSLFSCLGRDLVMVMVST